MMKHSLSACLLSLCLAWTAMADPTGRPYLGILGENAPATADEKTPPPEGAVIREVAADSPAAKAGLLSGDRIVGLNDQPIKSFEDLKVRIGVLQPNEKITLRVVREGKDINVPVELGEAKNPPKAAAERGLRNFLDDNLPIPREGIPPQLEELLNNGIPANQLRNNLAKPRPMVGVEVQAIDDALRNHLKLGDLKGVVVADVLPESPAAKEGIQSEDVITHADDKPVSDPVELKEIIAAKKAGDKIKLTLVRAGEKIEKLVTVEEKSPAQEGLSWRMPNLSGLDERFEALQQRLGQLEKNIEEKLGQKAEGMKDRVNEAEQQAAKSAAERIEQLEKRIAQMEANAENLASKAVQQLETKVEQLTKKLEELAAPKEPVK
jgi:C-terminal processing protease CtpA/Prc